MDRKQLQKARDEMQECIDAIDYLLIPDTEERSNANGRSEAREKVLINVNSDGYIEFNAGRMQVERKC